MMPTWSHSRHTLGVEEMDDDHREFLALLEILNEASDAEFPTLFQKLVDHVRLHFVREGRLMRLSKFLALGEHEGEHHRVLGELLQFNRNVKRGRLSLARAYVRIGLPEWFELHLLTMDSALAVWRMSIR
jgi:hemerythrin-like metal-binding protein